MAVVRLDCYDRPTTERIYTHIDMGIFEVPRNKVRTLDRQTLQTERERIPYRNRMLSKIVFSAVCRAAEQGGATTVSKTVGISVVGSLVVF